MYMLYYYENFFMLVSSVLNIKFTSIFSMDLITPCLGSLYAVPYVKGVKGTFF